MTASGEVRPIRYINVISVVPGKVREIYVNPGDWVTKDQALVLIDTSQEAQSAVTQASTNDLQNARSARTSAEQASTLVDTEVAQARQAAVTAASELKTSEREFKRAKDLMEAKVVSLSEYNSARDRYDDGKAKLEARNLALKEAEERANRAHAAVKEARSKEESMEMRANQLEAFLVLLRSQSSWPATATLRSPLDGIVADIQTRTGEVVLTDVSGTPLMTIADMSRIYVEVNVDQPEGSDVKVGQQVRIKVDAFGEREISGLVTAKNPVAVTPSNNEGDPSNRVNFQAAKVIKVSVEMREMSREIRDRLRPGMSATATITIKTKKTRANHHRRNVSTTASGFGW